MQDREFLRIVASEITTLYFEVLTFEASKRYNATFRLLITQVERDMGKLVSGTHAGQFTSW